MTEGWSSTEAIDICFLINKPAFPRRGATAKTDFSSWDSERLEEHLVMGMTAKTVEKTSNCTVSSHLTSYSSVIEESQATSWKEGAHVPFFPDRFLT